MHDICIEQYAPDGNFMKPFVRLPLTEHVEVTAGTELGQQTRPPWRIQRGIERGQKWVVQLFQYFLLYPRPTLFVPTLQLLLVHHFGGEHAPNLSLQLHEKHAPDVAGAEPVYKPEVAEPQHRVTGLLRVLDCLQARITCWCMGFA